MVEFVVRLGDRDNCFIFTSISDLSRKNDWTAFIKPVWKRWKYFRLDSQTGYFYVSGKIILCVWSVQWDPKKCDIERRLLDFSSDFK